MAAFPLVNGVEVLRLPPEGYEVDFAHPKSQRVLDHYLIFAIMSPLALAALAQRFYVKIFLVRRGLHVDDYLMLVGWLCSVLTQALMTTTIAQGGLCHHSFEMSLKDFERYALITYITAPIYQLCNGFVKLSLLSVYLQIFPQKWLRICIWFSILLVTAYTVIISFMMWFNCKPIRKQFDFSITHGSCIDAGALYMATAASNIATDAILFILPMPMLYKLRMERTRKLAAALIFGLGSATMATSIVRLVYLPSTLKSTDISWDAAPANIWTFIEGNLFVICGSVPTMSKFFKHFAPGIFRSHNASAGHTPSRSGPSYDSKPRSENRKSEYSRFTTDEDSDDKVELGPLRKDICAKSHKSVVDARQVRQKEVKEVLSENGAHEEEMGRRIVQTKTFAVQYNRKESVGS